MAWRGARFRLTVPRSTLGVSESSGEASTWTLVRACLSSNGDTKKRKGL